jgi:hypothetical protein
MLLALAGLLSACRAWQSLFGVREVAVPVTVVTLVPVTPPSMQPPPLPACTPMPAGMALTATVQSSGVVVEVTGLQPGERPTFEYAHTPAGRPPERFSVIPGEPVGVDGRAVDATWLRTTAMGSTPEIWDIRVVHVQGVACTQLLLPPRSP